MRLVLGGGGCLAADVAILATGNPPPVAPLPVPDSPRFVADPWAPGALDPVTDGRPVVILGTGLTMLDVAMSVTGGRPPAQVTAVSRHGLLPQVHRGMPAPGGDSIWLPALAGPAGAVLDSAGTPSGTLFTLGPPLRGLRYETTAIPEIRDQAAALARQLTSTLAARYRPDSAA